VCFLRCFRGSTKTRSSQGRCARDFAGAIVCPERGGDTMLAGHRSPMSDLARFAKWLWSDWGRNDFLTRFGIPPLLTNLLAYFGGGYFFYLIERTYFLRNNLSEANRFYRSPLVIAAFAVFYVTVLSYRFLESPANIQEPKMKGPASIPHRWKGSVYKIYVLSFLCAAGLLCCGWFLDR
jgi:hypothetical protein